MRRLLRIYLVLLGAAFRSDLQYRANLVLTLAGALSYQAVTLAFIWSILTRFGNLGGWTLTDVAFLFSARLTAHGLWTVPTSQLTYVDDIVREGEYDRYLVRPVPPLMQLLTRRIRLATFGDFLGGVVLLVVTSGSLPIEWSPARIAYLVIALLGGAMVEGAVQLATASFVFRFHSALPLQFAADALFNQYGNYPLKIFAPALQLAFTFVLPLAFVAYFPTVVLLGRGGDLIVPMWLAWAAPFVGAVLLWLAYRLWRRQARHYQSSGS